MRELRRALIALGYFTRLPLPAWVGWSASELDRAARYFPLAGLVVGAVSAAVLAAALCVLPAGLAVALSIVASLLFTGAFHEDGLADAVDGFGGGYTRDRVLAIMHDSRIGSFGAAALVLALLVKHQALTTLAAGGAAPAVVALLVAHPFSRFSALIVMLSLPYARADDPVTRAKPVAQGTRIADAAIAGVFCIGFGAAVCGLGGLTVARAAAAFAIAPTVGAVAARYFNRRLSGYTGDCLGATQQAAELAIYCLLVVPMVPR